MITSGTGRWALEVRRTTDDGRESVIAQRYSTRKAALASVHVASQWGDVSLIDTQTGAISALPESERPA